VGGGGTPRPPGSYAYVFDKRRYPACPASIFQPDQIDLQSSLQTSKKENSKVKSIIKKNFKILENDPDVGRIFSQTPFILFKTSKKNMLSTRNF